MYRFKTLTGNCLWARYIVAQATEVSVHVDRINPHGGLRSSVIRSYRVKLCLPMPLRLYARFMQQGPARDKSGRAKLGQANGKLGAVSRVQ
ncbi:MAG: hypothetical protein E5299_01993 [Burkholderia gladioli]|nr:MAG: hypothetical protein E5299_01993 [Burkholderia gladioli]